jgi:3-deoxy-manno-octulosonate cytidylyltransferase (CMP-KDO synthetase)
MNVVAIIPARMASSRFPGKPMAPILGLPMIGHVYLRTTMSQSLSDCWVATCDKVIRDYIESIGGKAVMTADTHERCSDRCAEAMLKIEEITSKNIDIVVVVQGDEPLVTPKMIDVAVKALKDAPDVGVACLMGLIESDENFHDPNEIKVVVDRKERALYMSREPIPTNKRGAKPVRLKQVCIIPYTRDYLLRFNNMAPTPLEIAESIDLNRCLENGDRVQMAFIADPTVSVDAPEDLGLVEDVMKNDRLVGAYLKRASSREKAG